MAQGIYIFLYLVSILVRSPSYHQGVKDTEQTVSCLQDNGLMINREKNLVSPVQWILHLGVTIDTAQDQVFFYSKKDWKRSLLEEITQQSHVKVQVLVRLLEMLVSCQKVVSWARFHARSLQRLLYPFQNVITHRM